MSKTEKRLKLTEIKAIEPKAELYELNKYSKYIIIVPKSNLLLNQNIEKYDAGKQIMRIMAAFQIPCAIFVGSTDDIRIIELQAEKV